MSSLRTQPELLMQPGNEALLEGKLRLVRELLRALDKPWIGGSSNGQPSLIELLLKRWVTLHARCPERVPLCGSSR